MMSRLTVLTIVFLSSVGYGQQSYLPPNNLDVEDNLNSNEFFAASGLIKNQFDQVVDKTLPIFTPIFKKHGATLKIIKLWETSEVNAKAYRRPDAPNIWFVEMYGGLARRPEVSADGFQLVLCHEIGHHLAGYHFVHELEGMASEGESDYFAAQACARKIWKSEPEENARVAAEAPREATELCSTTWRTTEDKNLCARILVAGLGLGELLQKLNEEANAPALDTPDERTVLISNVKHPKSQCRTDTTVAGALCAKAFNFDVIPGIINGSAQNSNAAEKEAFKTSCSKSGGDRVGLRPRCWFKPLTE